MFEVNNFRCFEISVNKKKGTVTPNVRSLHDTGYRKVREKDSRYGSESPIYAGRYRYFLRMVP